MKRITSLLLATVAGAGLMSSAYAADLIVEEPAYVEPLPVSVWDGAFIGGFIGGGWADADHEPAGGGDGNDVELSGWFVGVDAGFNFTVGSGIVLGIVGDISWADINGSLIGPTPIGGYDEITHDIDWMGSLRGRVGFDGGAFLPYLTGGLAFAHAERETFGPDDGPFENTHVGWTLGAGVEFLIYDDVSLDLLYRFSDYGSEVYNDGGLTVPEVSLTTHTVQAGLHWNF